MVTGCSVKTLMLMGVRLYMTSGTDNIFSEEKLRVRVKCRSFRSSSVCVFPSFSELFQFTSAQTSEFFLFSEVLIMYSFCGNVGFLHVCSWQ